MIFDQVPEPTVAGKPLIVTPEIHTALLSVPERVGKPLTRAPLACDDIVMIGSGDVVPVSEKERVLEV